MNTKQTKFGGVEEITPTIYEDNRGHSFEFPNPPPKFVSSYCSFSKKGTLRGLHYQLYVDQWGNHIWREKIVRCLDGKIFDVVVDVQPESATYGQYYTAYLSSRNYTSITVPGGYAHGFLALEDSLVLYQMSDMYRPECERTIRWDDMTLDINWPTNNEHLLISEKDRNGEWFRDILTE